MSEQNTDEAVTVLRRARRGDTYHRASCPVMGPNTLPWNWAEGRYREDLDRAKANGLRACKVCDPDGALPSWWSECSEWLGPWLAS